jgi:hypothetical protein
MNIANHKMRSCRMFILPAVARMAVNVVELSGKCHRTGDLAGAIDAETAHRCAELDEERQSCADCATRTC